MAEKVLMEYVTWIHKVRISESVLHKECHVPVCPMDYFELKFALHVVLFQSVLNSLSILKFV